jgi:hypothetical protein
MDCEKFDQHVIDALYDELDELTHAALKRHVEGCSRCAGIYAGLRATREVGILPMVEPPDDLEARILDAVTIAQRSTPLHKKVLRGLAWAGSHAMRPQLAMAALFFLVIGSSLLLLRARPGTLGPVRVTENGAPTPEVAAAAAPAATAAAAAPADQGVAKPSFAGALASAAPQREETLLAEKSKLAKVDQDGSDGRAALAEARALRDGSGCNAAVGKLDEVAVRFAGTQAASDAMWDEASCYKQMGDRSRAQQIYLSLRSTGYRDRAQRELVDADNNSLQGNALQNQGGGTRVGAAAPAAAAAAPAAPKAAVGADAIAEGQPAKAPSAVAGAGPGNARAAKSPAAAAPNPKAPAAPTRAYGYSP